MKAPSFDINFNSAFLAKARGFTLIELLVTIAIVGVLATIGLTAFSTTQASARDGRRRSELEQLAKSIELTKDAATNIYDYDSADFTVDFGRTGSAQLLAYTDPSGIPYCVRTATTVGVTTTVPADWTGATCPTSYVTLSTTLVRPGTPVANNLYNNDVRSWVICSHLERTATPFCVNSTQ